MNVLSEYRGFRPIGATIFEKKSKEVEKKPFFAKDKCAPLKSPEEITVYLRIGHFYETPIFFDQSPISDWSGGSTLMHVIHHKRNSVTVINENDEFTKVRKKCRFLKNLSNNCYFWAPRSLLSLKMNIILNICPSQMPKL